jgi:predicted nucleic acid-binding protein
MRKTLFLDTNVILDIVLEREEFVTEARRIVALRDTDRADLYISVLTIAHVSYFAKRFGKDPSNIISKILYWFEVIDLNKDHVEQALVSKFSDFEDALQYFSARQIRGIDCIITRDVAGFKHSRIPVLSPGDFLKSIVTHK